MFYFCDPPHGRRFEIKGSEGMHHDPQMRAAARAVYDACYPSDDWARLGFDDAERHRTVEYRQSVDAARQVRSVLASPGEQLALDALL